MNGNLKALKKILFILQKSYSGLEHKLVIWDYLKIASRKQPGLLRSSLKNKPSCSDLARRSPSLGRAIHWDICSLGIEKFFYLNTKPKTHLQKSIRMYVVFLILFENTHSGFSMVSSPTAQRH